KNPAVIEAYLGAGH
ncbi:hypothetical protein, partial [Salmonella enterica]